MFNVGDEVRVIPGKQPRHGWGSVDPEDVGVVRKINTVGYWVDFPRHPNWNAGANDLELVDREPDWEV